MKHLSSVAAALVVLVVASSSAYARGGGNFVSVFDAPKFGVCFVDLHETKGDTDDVQEEIAAAQAIGERFGDFRGVRPDQVAKAHYKQCGKKDVPPKDELPPKG